MNQRLRPKAVTLIELLIVMGLLVLLASISLGAMRTMLRGQKVAQASITVKQYLQNAQIRAVASGRPVAVFFERVSMASGPAGQPIGSNFAVTRLQTGEVFPPYTGDFENAQGRLIDSLSTGTNAPDVGYANAIVFEANASVQNPIASVVSGIGEISGSGTHLPGFISVGDVIEFDGCEAKFAITAFTILGALPKFPFGGIAVHFTNSSLEVLDTSLATPTFRTMQIPLSGINNYRKFRVYRQPTKSLVGAVVLPRGACVDLSLSGVGLNNSAVEGGTFSLSEAPLFAGDPLPLVLTKTQTPGDFSRVAIVFNSDGRVSYLMREDSVMRGPSFANRALRRLFLDGSQMIYLMVGRTDQVLPGFPGTNARVAALQHPEFGAGELPKSNLVDPENIWITCNPITGEVKTSPVAAIDDAVIQARSATPLVPISDLINHTRSLAAAGMTN